MFMMLVLWLAMREQHKVANWCTICS